LNKEKVKSNVCQIEYCDRPTHKDSKYCIFHAKPDEKDEKEFKKSFEKYIEEIKRSEKAQHDFKQFIFISDINFKEDFKISTFKNADFTGAIFKGKVDFFDIVFKGDTSFGWAVFFKDVNFHGSTFVEKVKFSFATFMEEAKFFAIKFKGNAKFDEANFKGYSGFSAVIFYTEADYRGSTFEGNIEFTMGITFKGDALFNAVVFEKGPKFYITSIESEKKEYITVFEGPANFQSAVFKDDPVFGGAIFKSNVVFSGASFPTGSRLLLKVINGNKLLLDGSFLENIFLELDLGENVMVNLNNVMLRNTKIEKKEIFNRILQEKKKKYSEAKEIYLLLKNNFHSIGRYEDESWAFKKEKDMERFAHYKNGRYLKGIISGFLNFIYGYGEEPSKVFRFAVIIILFFSFLYFNYGISVFIPEVRNIQYDFFKNIWLGIGNIELLSSIIKNFPWRDYLNSLYFSLTTFATLAFGNIGPLTITSKIIAGIESFIGPFTIALFVYTFARRTGGR
jgi:uncharacterized protein YjbI with pentapeptide repeats